MSPNLEIYDYGQTWFGHSAWQRITGSIFSGGMYVYATAYLAAPLVGWHLESASIAAAVAGMSFAVKGALKFLIAWPFVFHSVNGVRHLLWDRGFGFVRDRITNTGWVVWSVSVVGGLFVAFGL